MLLLNVVDALVELVGDELSLLWIDEVDEVGEFSGRKNGSGGRSGERDLQSSVVWDEVALLVDLFDIVVVFSWRHHDFIWILFFISWIFESGVFTNNCGILLISRFIKSLIFGTMWK